MVEKFNAILVFIFYNAEVFYSQTFGVSMAYAKLFFIKPSGKKIISIYQIVKKEFEEGMQHIESSYSEILNNNTLNTELITEMKGIQGRIRSLLSNWTRLFIKDEQSLIKDVCQLRIDILRLKTKFMISHILLNHDKYTLEDYKFLVTDLHNCLEVFNDNVFQIKQDEFDMYGDLSSERYEWFEEVYSILCDRYVEFKNEFSIGDVWEDWSYDGGSSTDDSDDSYSVNSLDNFKP